MEKEELNERLLEETSTDDNVDINNNNSSNGEASQAKPLSFVARHKKFMIASGIFLVVAVATVAALAGTDNLKPSSSSSRPGPAAQDPALANMPQPNEMAASLPGYRRFVLSYQGESATHESTIHYDVEISDKAVNLDNVTEAVKIECAAPYGTAVSPDSPVEAEDIMAEDAAAANSTTEAPAADSKVLTVYFDNALSAEKYALAWNNGTLLLLLHTWGCGDAVVRIVDVDRVEDNRVYFLTEEGTYGDVFNNAHFFYNVTATNDTSTAGRRRRDLNYSKSTSFSKTYQIFSESSGPLSGSVSCTLGVDFSFQASMSFSWGVPSSFSTSVSTNGHFSLDWSLSASSSWSKSYGPKTTSYADIFSVTVWVSFVPVPVSLKVAGKTGASVSISGRASLSQSIGISGGSRVNVGWTNSNGLSKSISNNPPAMSVNRPSFSASASATLQVYAGPSVFLKLAGLGGPVFDVPITGQVVASAGTGSSCRGVTVDVNAWLSAKVSALFDALSFSKSTSQYTLYESPHRNLFHRCY